MRFGVRVVVGRRRALAAEEKKSPVVGGGPGRVGVVRRGVLKRWGLEVEGLRGGVVVVWRKSLKSGSVGDGGWFSLLAGGALALVGRVRDLKPPEGELLLEAASWDLVGDGNNIRRVG